MVRTKEKSMPESTEAILMARLKVAQQRQQELHLQYKQQQEKKEQNLQGLREEPVAGLVYGSLVVSLMLLLAGGRIVYQNSTDGWLLIIGAIIIVLGSLGGFYLYHAHRLRYAAATTIGGLIVAANILLFQNEAIHSFYPYLMLGIVVVSSLMLVARAAIWVSIICVVSHAVVIGYLLGTIPAWYWPLTAIVFLMSAVIMVSTNHFLTAIDWAFNSQVQARLRGDQLFQNERQMKKIHAQTQTTHERLTENQQELELTLHQLEDLVAELYAINASKDRFFSIVAHDLRGPFSPLMGLSELLPIIIDTASPEEVIEMCEIIHGSATNVYRLLENLLQWSRLQMGRMEHTPEPIKLAELATETIRLLDELAKQKEITLTQEIDPDLMVHADENMLYTIIRNLVNNALKFTPTHGDISITAARKKSMVEISVIDTGVGIKPQDLEKLFRLDVQHTTSGTAEEKGTGLGLILCQEMVHTNGGKIWVTSEVGHGTIMTFTMPIWVQSGDNNLG